MLKLLHNTDSKKKNKDLVNIKRRIWKDVWRWKDIWTARWNSKSCWKDFLIQ